MISAVGNVSNSKNNPSFGRLAPEVKHVMRTPEVKAALTDLGISATEIKALDKSPLYFSLIADFFESAPKPYIPEPLFQEIPKTAGLVLISPPNTKLPNLCLTGCGSNHFLSGPSDFAKTVKKAVDMNAKFAEVRLELSKRLAKATKNSKVKELEDNADALLKEYILAFNAGDKQELPLLNNQLKHIQSKVTTESKDLSAAAQLKKEARNTIRVAWEELNIAG